MYRYLMDCRKIEEITARIYQRFAANRIFSVEVRAVFQQLSQEETAHARHLDLVIQSDRREVPVVARIARDKLNEVLGLAVGFEEQAKHGQLQEEDALRMAVNIEREFIKVHVQNVLAFCNPELEKLFADLAQGDQHHIDTLNACVTAWNEKNT